MEWMREVKLLESIVDATHPRVCGRVLTTITFFFARETRSFFPHPRWLMQGAAYRRSEECVCVCVKD